MEWKLASGDLTEHTPEFDLYSTVDIADCRLIRQQDTVSFQATFRNYAVQPVCGLRLSLVCRDAMGEILPFQGNSSCECPIESLQGQPKATFMMPVPIGLWDNRAHSLEITVIQVRYAGGQESVISRHQMIAPDAAALKEEQKDVLDGMLARPEVLPEQAADYWLCACGTPNVHALNACRWCGQEKASLFELTRTEHLDRLAAQRQADDEAQQLLREQEEAAAALKRKKMTRRILVPVIAVFAAAVAIAGAFLARSYVWIPRQHYNTALEYLESGSYTSAAGEFLLAGRYRDAQEQYLKALFQNAVQALESAESASEYEAAIALFEELDGYGDSESEIRRARYSLALLLMEAQEADAYREAVAQLELAAGYQDGEAQLQEARYQLALLLLA
ncbi:MAG: hypothetical protein LIO46_07300, partial [Clostridiales bacterium]|nr:hypothetical protein [Clostridiales bacterium]